MEKTKTMLATSQLTVFQLDIVTDLFTVIGDPEIVIRAVNVIAYRHVSFCNKAVDSMTTMTDRREIDD